jgi:hypothetical protein
MKNSSLFQLFSFSAFQRFLLISAFQLFSLSAFAQTASVTVNANGDVLNGKAINFATSKLKINGVAVDTALAAKQPLDPDLTALAALSGTNTIYYRSAANTWSPITIGGNLTFSGGTLNALGGTETDPVFTAAYSSVGDIVTYGNSSAIDTLPVGANNTFLVADDGQPLGLKWANATTSRGALGLGTAATANTGTSGANIPFLNGANTWTAGATQTFGANATNPGFKFNGVTADPSVLSEGAHWYRTDTHKLRVYDGTAARSLLMDSDIGANVQAYDSGLGLVKPAVAVVATSNLTLSGEQTIDGQLTSSSLVLCTAQTTGANNGPWISGSGAWTRPTWYATGSTSQAPQFLTTFVRLGTTYSGSTWRMTTASVTIGTTAQTWVQTPISLASSNVTGTLPAANVSTLNQNTTGSAASLSISGQTGLFTITGLTSTNRAKTVRDAADTILELGGSYTPSGTWTNMTLVTPALGTPSSGTLTNATGLPITGITSSTSAQLRTLLSDENGTGVALFDGATSPAFTTPKVTTGINDANGNSILAFTATASAVDGFTFTNSATGNPAAVTMAATGSDANIDLNLNAKGTGDVNITANGSTGNTITLTARDSIISLSDGGVGTSFTDASTVRLKIIGGAVRNQSTGNYGWSSATNPNSAVADTALSRNAAGVVEVNNGTAISGTSNAGSIKALTFIPVGTATSCTGGTIGTGSKSNAGFVTSDASGTIVITFPVTAPTGWNVIAVNKTSAARPMNMTANSTTTATLTGSPSNNDVIHYIAMAY